MMARALAMLALAAATLAVPGVRAEPRLGAHAFVPPSPCRVEPFGDGAAAQYLDELRRACGGESTRFALAAPTDDAQGPGLLKAQAERLDSRRFGPLLASVRLAWSAAGEADGRLRTEQALLGAGGFLRLASTLALRAHFGLEASDGARHRTRVAGLWRPRERDLLFAEWVGSEDRTDHVAVGLRWTLPQRRLAVDIGARHLPSGTGWIEPRIALRLPAFGG